MTLAFSGIFAAGLSRRAHLKFHIPTFPVDLEKDRQMGGMWLVDDPAQRANTIMNLSSIRLLPLLLLGGCAMLSPLNDEGGKTSEVAADGSSTSITRDQAWKIAKAAVAEREGWPERQRGSDGRIHGVLYSLRRINHGGYRVEAHRSIQAPPHPCEVYDSTPPVVMVIDRQGQVTHYVRQRKP